LRKLGGGHLIPGPDRARPGQHPDDEVQDERAQSRVVGDGRWQHVPDRQPADLRVADQQADGANEGLARCRGGHRSGYRPPHGIAAQSAQQPAAIADDTEHQRVLASQVASRRSDIEAEAGQEAGHRARRRTAIQSKRNHHKQDQIGGARSGPGQPVHHRQLEQQRHDHPGG
jgi:hypothetical protein